MAVPGNQMVQSIIAERSDRDGQQPGALSTLHTTSVVTNAAEEDAGRANTGIFPRAPSGLPPGVVTAGRHRRMDSGASDTTPSYWRAAAGALYADEGGGDGGPAGSVLSSGFGRGRTRRTSSSAGSAGGSGMSRWGSTRLPVQFRNHCYPPPVA